jgi:hypothetical protein
MAKLSEKLDSFDKELVNHQYFQSEAHYNTITDDITNIFLEGDLSRYKIAAKNLSLRRLPITQGY